MASGQHDFIPPPVGSGTSIGAALNTHNNSTNNPPQPPTNPHSSHQCIRCRKASQWICACQTVWYCSNECHEKFGKGPGTPHYRDCKEILDKAIRKRVQLKKKEEEKLKKAAQEARRQEGKDALRTARLSPKIPSNSNGPAPTSDTAQQAPATPPIDPYKPFSYYATGKAITYKSITNKSYPCTHCKSLPAAAEHACACHQAYYCSATCKKAAAPDHAHACGVIQAVMLRFEERVDVIEVFGVDGVDEDSKEEFEEPTVGGKAKVFDYEAEAEEVREKLESVPEFSEREKKRISPTFLLCLRGATERLYEKATSQTFGPKVTPGEQAIFETEESREAFVRIRAREASKPTQAYVDQYHDLSKPLPSIESLNPMPTDPKAEGIYVAESGASDEFGFNVYARNLAMKLDDLRDDPVAASKLLGAYVGAFAVGWKRRQSTYNYCHRMKIKSFQSNWAFGRPDGRSREDLEHIFLPLKGEIRRGLLVEVQGAITRAEHALTEAVYAEMLATVTPCSGEAADFRREMGRPVDYAGPRPVSGFVPLNYLHPIVNLYGLKYVDAWNLFASKIKMAETNGLELPICSTGHGLCVYLPHSELATGVVHCYTPVVTSKWWKDRIQDYEKDAPPLIILHLDPNTPLAAHFDFEGEHVELDDIFERGSLLRFQEWGWAVEMVRSAGEMEGLRGRVTLEKATMEFKVRRDDAARGVYQARVVEDARRADAEEDVGMRLSWNRAGPGTRVKYPTLVGILATSELKKHKYLRHVGYVYPSPNAYLIAPHHGIEAFFQNGDMIRFPALGLEVPAETLVASKVVDTFREERELRKLGELRPSKPDKRFGKKRK